MRRRFSDVLRTADINIVREYKNLVALFCNKKDITDGKGDRTTYSSHCASNFLLLPEWFRNGSINIFDFMCYYGIVIKDAERESVSIDDLVNLCEYVYNIANAHGPICFLRIVGTNRDYTLFLLNHIESLVEKIGYMPNRIGNITDFVPKNQAAIAVAEIIEEDLAYDVIEYNHHSMCGNLSAKGTVLRKLGNQLEPRRSSLEMVNKELSDNIFFILNNMNLRHNNSTQGDKNYKPFVCKMPKSELEIWYDELYQMCLLAFLELDNIERMERMKDLKRNFKLC